MIRKLLATAVVLSLVACQGCNGGNDAVSDWEMVDPDSLDERTSGMGTSLMTFAGSIVLAYAVSAHPGGSLLRVRRYQEPGGAWSYLPDPGKRAQRFDLGYMGSVTLAYGDLDNGGKAGVLIWDYLQDRWVQVGQGGVTDGAVRRIYLEQDGSDTIRHYLFCEVDTAGPPTAPPPDAPNWGLNDRPRIYTLRSGLSPSWTFPDWQLASDTVSDTGQAILFSGTEKSGNLLVAYSTGARQTGSRLILAHATAPTAGLWHRDQDQSQGRPGEIALSRGTVVYSDFGLDWKLVAKKFNKDTQQWELLGTAGFSDEGASQIAMTFGIDKSGGGSQFPTRPYIVYQGIPSHKLTVMKWNGSQWITIGTPRFSPGAATSPSIAFDNTRQEIYVSFIDWSSSSTFGARVRVMRHAND